MHISNLESVLRNAGRLSEAVLCYKKVILIYLIHAEYHNHLGAPVFESRELMMAKTNFEKAIELNSNYINAQNNLGGVLKPLAKIRQL